MSLTSDSSRLFSFLRRWARGIRHIRGIIAAAVVLGGVSGLASTGLLALISRMLGGSMASTGRLLLVFAALALLLPVCRFLSAVMLLRLTVDAAYELRLRLCHSVLSAPLPLLERHGTHRILTVLSEDIAAITLALTNLPNLFMQIAIVLGSLVYLGWLSWQVLLVVLGFMVVGIASYQLPMLISAKHFQSLRDFMDVLTKHFTAVTEGSKELKLHRPRREAFVDTELIPTLRSVRSSAISANTTLLAAVSWGQTLFFVLIGLILFVQPALRGAEQQVLIGYCLVILYMMAPLEGIMGIMPSLSRAAIAIETAERLGLVLADGAAPRGPHEAAVPQRAWERLELVGATHTYHREGEAGSFVVGPIDLTLRPGELVFLTGGNGSGKTTLAKVLTGLYAPENGEIRLDGRTVDEQSSEWYRQHFSVVFNDFYLFEKLLGLEAEDLDDRARQQLVRLKLDHKVEVRGGTLSTLELSQGQRKRLALLTAWLEDRPIYLFDEWAADQDSLFKEIFYLQLLPDLKTRGKTVIVISHDDRYYGVADRILKLDYGQIVYDGSPDEEKVEIEGLTRLRRVRS